jgi:hypothetical protein
MITKNQQGAVIRFLLSRGFKNKEMFVEGHSAPLDVTMDQTEVYNWGEGSKEDG